MSPDIIIRKQKIRVVTSGKETAIKMRGQLNDSFQYKLISLFEDAFAPFAGNNSYLNINKISISVGPISKKDFDTRLLELINHKLRQQLEKITTGMSYEMSTGEDISAAEEYTNNKPGFETTNKKKITALLYFLEYGIYPWWFTNEVEKHPAFLFENFVDSNWEYFIVELISLSERGITSYSAVSNRIFNFLPQTLYTSLIEAAINFHNNQELKTAIREIIKRANDLETTTSKKELYKSVLAGLLSSYTGKNINENISEILNHFKYSKKGSNKSFDHIFLKPVIDSGNQFGNETGKPVLDDLFKDHTLPKKSLPKEYKEIYISNAGLILVHPFWGNLFKELQLINEEGIFYSEETKQKAAVVLYFLQSGKEEYEEWEMFFNKIICDIPPGNSIPNDIKLSQNEKNECEQLLQTLINYWSALKGSGIAAIQNTFLIRNGKISRREDNWLLQVERTGSDILLDKLPWSFAIVKLPWLNELIYTEW